jgi:hypothetical protein
VPRHPEVTPIQPLERDGLSFFPGHRGFLGSSFPVGGVMLVANNFDNLANWLKYESDPSAVDDSRTSKNMRKILAAASVALEDCWFTNYALGVMDRPTSQYEFPRRIREQLELARVFRECVDIMRPRLIVAMGDYAQDYLKVRRGEVFDLHGTRAVAIWHPSARYKGDAHFVDEGRRIREALEAA